MLHEGNEVSNTRRAWAFEALAVFVNLLPTNTFTYTSNK